MMKRVLGVLVACLLVAAACGDDDSETTTETSAPAGDPSVEETLAAFCAEGQSYIDALDTYGMIFDESEPTVGDLREGVDPLLAAGEQARAAGEELAEAIEIQDAKIAEAEEEARIAAEEAAAAGEEPPSTTSTSVVTVEVSDDTLAQVEAAEANFDEAIEGVDDSTPLADADVALTSSAYALEVTWFVLLLEAGCIEDEGQAVEQIRSIVAATQTDLTTAGYYSGPVDGVYGPETADAVKALQAANGLPETGYLDPLSQEALAEELEGKASAQVAAIQGVLTSLGFYTGPIDGQWTPAVEEALKAFQADLGVPQTGVVDDATLRAYQDRLAEAEAALDNSTSTTTAPPTTAPPTTEATTSTTAAEG